MGSFKWHGPSCRLASYGPGWDGIDVRFALLGSSSAGNSCLVTAEDASGRHDILIDAGLSPRTLEEALSGMGVAPSSLSAVFFTHGHMDHVRSARFIARRTEARLFAPAGALKTVMGLAGRRVDPVTPPPYLSPANAELPETTVGPFTLVPFRVPHDFPDTVGYRVTAGNRTLAYATDIGCPTPRIEEALAGADAVVLEANHDPEMLRSGPYPAHLKTRIGGGLGHLANPYAAALLAHAFSGAARGPARVVLAHLSETNNTPDAAVDTVRNTLAEGGTPVPVEAAPPRGPTDLWALR